MATANRRRANNQDDTPGETADTPNREERVGLQLRNARRSKNLSLTDVAQELKIRKVYIEAIEKSQFSDLPGPTYAIGFARSYAQLLDLDRDLIVERFRSEIAGLEKVTELHFLLPSKEKRIPGFALVGASLVLAAAVYGGWYLMSSPTGIGGLLDSASRAKPAKTKSVVKTGKHGGKGTANAVAKPPAGKSGRNTKARPGKAHPGKDAEAVKATLKPAVATGPGVVSEAAVRASADRVARGRARTSRQKAAMERAAAHKAAQKIAVEQAAKRKAAQAAEAAKRAGDSGPVSGKARIVLKATQTTWVKLQLTDGTLVFSRILKAGEVFPVVQNRVLLLTAGNAGGLRIVVDGRVLPALGPAGAVRQNIRLDADALLASR
jgi:cytoskeleton protein RodZ